MNIDIQLKSALRLQQDDKLAEAKELFEKILELNPDNPDALHGLGLLFAQTRDFKQATYWLEKATLAAPHIPAFHNNLANAYKATKQFELAKRHYNQALRLKSPYPEARNNLGCLLYQNGSIVEAIKHLQKAVREDPEHVDAHYNLANCYIQNDRLLDASSHYHEVLKLRPDHHSACHNLGIVLTALKDFARAKPYLSQALKREPNNVDALFHLGIIEASQGQLGEAIILYKKTIAVSPDHADAYHNLATVLLHEKQAQEALLYYKKAFELNPYNKTAEHMIFALQGEQTSLGAPHEYVRALFDQYAYSYDQHVGKTLEYQVPAMLRQALSSHIATSEQLWDVLDLGCGTGLSAPYFRDISKKLVGVDLSPNMIEVAMAQKGYDKLTVQDATSFLQQTKDSFNLIIAADVFVYFADLDAIFELIASRLAAKGFFAFSVEALTGESHYQLLPTGRYAHSQAYIESLCAKHKLEGIFQEHVSLRKQEGEDIFGYVMVLRKI